MKRKNVKPVRAWALVRRDGIDIGYIFCDRGAGERVMLRAKLTALVEAVGKAHLLVACCPVELMSKTMWRGIRDGLKDALEAARKP